LAQCKKWLKVSHTVLPPHIEENFNYLPFSNRNLPCIQANFIRNTIHEVQRSTQNLNRQLYSILTSTDRSKNITISLLAFPGIGIHFTAYLYVYTKEYTTYRAQRISSYCGLNPGFKKFIPKKDIAYQLRCSISYILSHCKRKLPEFQNYIMLKKQAAILGETKKS